ncbi:MAG: hypothetical protein U0841_02215 [Chloroflexia bacterium]
MMVDRFATERLAAERFTTMQQGIEEESRTRSRWPTRVASPWGRGRPGW